jgi:hypothetical protein
MDSLLELFVHVDDLLPGNFTNLPQSLLDSGKSGSGASGARFLEPPTNNSNEYAHDMVE